MDDIPLTGRRYLCTASTETGCSQDGKAWHSPFAKVELMRPDALKLIYRIEKKSIRSLNLSSWRDVSQGRT